MNPSDESTSAYLEHRALMVLLVGVSLALGWVLLPFYGTVLWAIIIALAFAPLHRRLLPRLRHRRTLAALLTLLAAVLVVILPCVLVVATLAREATLLYKRVQSGETNPVRFFTGLFDALPDSAKVLFGYFGLDNFADLQRRLDTAIVQGTEFIAAHLLSLGQDTFSFSASLFITIYLAFFLIRDGDRIVRSLRRAVPLEPAHKRELFGTFGTVLLATVRGNMLVAAIQGALGGLAFWVLGVSGALLWAVVMAVLSLLPAVGAALVWAPVAVWFFVNGAVWQGVALTAWGVVVIGLSDNLLRPILVGRDVGLPDYVVMITTLGGMAVFGINGFVLGPVIAAMFFAVWHLVLVTRMPTDD